MMRLPIYQKVTVDIGQYDDGLRDLIRRAVGAPRKADVTFHDRGVQVTWRRNKRAPI